MIFRKPKSVIPIFMIGFAIGQIFSLAGDLSKGKWDSAGIDAAFLVVDLLMAWYFWDGTD